MSCHVMSCSVLSCSVLFCSVLFFYGIVSTLRDGTSVFVNYRKRERGMSGCEDAADAVRGNVGMIGKSLLSSWCI